MLNAQPEKRHNALIWFLFMIIALISSAYPARDCPADEALLAINEAWTGDFDGMEKRRWVRVLMPYSKTHYFLDGANRRGDCLGLSKKQSPAEKIVDQFVAEHKQGSMFFNTITNRYLKNNKWVRNATATEEMKRFREAAEFIKKYAGQYQSTRTKSSKNSPYFSGTTPPVPIHVGFYRSY